MFYMFMPVSVDIDHVLILIALRHRIVDSNHILTKPTIRIIFDII
jgi:hypothetical protein